MKQPADKSDISRRGFFTAAASAIAAPYVVPFSVLGANSPSKRITVGILGMGSRGNSHARGFSSLQNAEVLAVCDPYRSFGEKARNYLNSQSGNSNCKAYQDFREILERDDIDTITIASPENWHAIQTIMAVSRKKDVYCEKAISLTVKEGIAMCDAVRRHGRILQVGTQQRSDQRFRFACELARNGYLGKIKEVRVGVPGGRALPISVPKTPPADLDYDLWLGPAPQTPYNDLKCKFNWYFISDYCAGWIQSWGVHHCDTALWGVPELAQGKVTAEGTAQFPTDGMADTSITWKTKVTSESGIVLSFASNNTPGHGQGCRFIGDNGWVHVTRGGIQAEPKSLLSVITKPHERLYQSRHHLGNFLECVQTRRDPAAPIEAGHKATAITLVADIATRLERKLTWDWSGQQFINDKTANQMLSRPMRAPWQI